MLQVDADELFEDRDVQRMVGRRQERGEVGCGVGRAGGLERLDVLLPLNPLGTRRRRRRRGVVHGRSGRRSVADGSVGASARRSASCGRSARRSRGPGSPACAAPRCGAATAGSWASASSAANFRNVTPDWPCGFSLDERVRVEPVDPPGPPHVPLGRPMERAAGANLVQRDDQQQLPQVLARRHVVAAFAGRMEEISEHRLDDVVGVQPAGQRGRTLAPGQRPQPIGIAGVEQSGRFAVAVLKSLQQAAIGQRAVFRRRAIGRAARRRP